MHCPFPVFYFVLLGVGFGVPSFAHNDHLAQVGDSVLLVDGISSTGDVSISNLSVFRLVLLTLSYIDTTRNLNNACVTVVLPVDVFKAGVALQFDLYDGSTRRYGCVKYVSDTSVNANDFHNISGNWKIFVYGIK